MCAFIGIASSALQLLPALFLSLLLPSAPSLPHPAHAASLLLPAPRAVDRPDPFVLLHAHLLVPIHSCLDHLMPHGGRIAAPSQFSAPVLHHLPAPLPLQSPDVVPQPPHPLLHQDGHLHFSAVCRSVWDHSV